MRATALVLAAAVVWLCLPDTSSDPYDLPRNDLITTQGATP